MKHHGYMGFHDTDAPNGEFSELSLTDADERAGWREVPLYEVGDDLAANIAQACAAAVTNWLNGDKRSALDLVPVVTDILAGGTPPAPRS